MGVESRTNLLRLSRSKLRGNSSYEAKTSSRCLGLLMQSNRPRSEIKFARRHNSLDKSGIVISAAEFAIAHDSGVKRHRGLDASDVILVEGAPHPLDGIDPCRAHRDDFCDQRIVIRWNSVTGINMRIDSNATAARCIIEVDSARRWLQTPRRAFRAATAFNCVEPGRCMRDVFRKRLACGNTNLFFHQIASVN